MRIVIAGLSVTSSWGNGHATNYRALMRELAARGHDVLFCERDVPWYAAARDLPEPPWGRTMLYRSLAELEQRAAADLEVADLTIVGSYVPEGAEVAAWALEHAGGIVAFYDIDTPVTLAKLKSGDCEYLQAELIPCFGVYLSFTGGPTLELLKSRYGARNAIAFHCLVDPHAYRPLATLRRWDLGYLGTYSPDRQRALSELLIEPAHHAGELRFAVAGPRYPEEIRWPANVRRVEHVAPTDHPAFYGAQRFTLNLTRQEMRAAGWSPSVRLFEAAACGVPVISDIWPGLEELFEPEAEILLAEGPEDVLRLLRDLPEQERLAIAARARRRVLAEHTAAPRCDALEGLAVGAAA